MTQKKETKERFERVPVSGLRDLLTVEGKDPDFHYRFVEDNDESGSRILKYKRGGYEFADSITHTVGQDSVYKSKSNGSIIRVPSGSGKFSYLMRIKQEWYKADQKAKADEIQEVENTIMRTGNAAGKTDLGQYGEVKIEH